MKTKLTKRERQITELIRLGNKAIDIADQLNISPKTVYKHTSNIHKKTATNSFSQIAIYHNSTIPGKNTYF